MKPIILHILFLIALSVFVWYQSLFGWFFYGNEAHHLFSNPDFSLPSLIKTHSVLYFISFSLFKWNPFGWYGLALFFHIVAGVLTYWFFLLITKRKYIAFIVAAGFLSNVSYIDIMLWGSFNALYPFSLCMLISSFILFFFFREKRKNIFYFFLYPIFILGLLMREIVVVLPFLLIIFDVLFFTPLNKKNWKNLIIVHTPLAGVLFAFILFRSINGGDPSDYVDERHRLRIGLFKSHMYIEYVFRVFLGFFKKIAEQIIPYPLVNNLRDLMIFVPREVILRYFFPTLGLIYFLFIGKALFLIKENVLFKTAAFSLIFMVILTGFFSLAMPETDSTLSGAYVWNGARYHYFSFWGLFSSAFFISLPFIDKIKKKAAIAFLLFLIIQIYFIKSISATVLRTTYNPSREFYKQMDHLFPDNKNLYFYVYPHASPLGDYLYEWNYLRSLSLADFKSGSTWESASIAITLKKIMDKTWVKDKVHFLDYDQSAGILDRRDDVLTLLSSVTTEIFYQEDLPIISLKKKLPVEIPYEIEIRMKADSIKRNKVNDYDEFLLNQLLSKFIVSASNTIKISEIDDHPAFLAKNIYDKNYGVHSMWIAEDTGNAEGSITIDMLEERFVEGFMWSNPSGTTGVPSTYDIFLSKDRKNWKKVKKVSGNKEKSKIDKFDKTVARYLRMDIQGTLLGDPPNIDEVEVVENIKVLNNAKDMLSLATNAINDGIKNGTNVTVGTITINTKSPKREYDLKQIFLIPLDGKMHTYTLSINDSEKFSIQGEFLSRNLVALSLSLPKVVNYQVEYVKIKPIFPTIKQ